MKKRIFSFDFIRAIAILCIIVFHFGNDGYKVYPQSLIFPNFDLGSFGVSLFFILSGASLRYSDEGRFTLKRHFSGRFWAIYPTFWIAFIMGIVTYRIYLATDPFFGVERWKLIYSFLGIDGWMSSFTTTFCVVGEWFLGCILIIYLVYPIIRILIDKIPIITIAGYFAISLIVIMNYNMPIIQIYNPILRGFEFTMGVAFAKLIVLHNEDKKMSTKSLAGSIVLSGAVMIVCLFAPLGIYQTTLIQIGGISSFTFLYMVGSLISNDIVKKVFETISRYSFQAFLVHHVINNCLMHYYLGHFSTSWKKTLVFFGVYILLTSVVTVFLYKISEVVKRIRYMGKMKKQHNT